ncbi:hypothetical protein HHK36_032116 [Tetracentron sinense]|uniref:Uncharacterized protein n=1 Tax=Tetracentron sinense TaxID=13715 RepID=A0A835D0Q9_TETSI|nr:hypothetical protein HHK36_032116 [Tetracentron sinense]
MAFTLRSVKVPPNSATLEEARHRTFDFFRTACRSIPSIMEIYNLHEVATISQLRSSISTQIRKNAHITNPKVIDMLLFKAIEELNNIAEHAKQRHHIIGQYVVGHKGLVQDLSTKDQGMKTVAKVAEGADGSVAKATMGFTKEELRQSCGSHRCFIRLSFLQKELQELME